MSGYFLPTADLHESFTYPELFHRVVSLGLTDWTPWRLLTGDPLLARHRGIASRYPDRTLIPFARRVDRDDVACWDLDLGGGSISVIDDFDIPGLEQLQTLRSFEDWLRLAFEEMLNWED